MVLRYFQKGFNYSQDGPGNRLVYHLQGCNLKCPWCSNPEGMNIQSKCIETDTDSIVTEILSCVPMFFENGGVTFTGGEATLQTDALYEIMKKVKEMNVNTAIETNASVNGIEKLSEVCDYWIIDFKHPDSNILKEITNGNIEIIKNNIFALAKTNFLHLRIPLIHGFNDSDKDLKEFSEFFNSLKNFDGKFDIEILPYHEYGKEKWEKTGKEYTVKNGFVTSETVNKFNKTFKQYGFSVIKT